MASQNPILALDDALLCDEQGNDFDLGIGFGSSDQKNEISTEKIPLFPHDLTWEEDELSSLLSKEKNTHLGLGKLINDEGLIGFRKESVRWIVSVSTHFGFVALTTILAVNYFDRFLLSPWFEPNKPWVSQLAAVASLSLASKVVEVNSRSLLDLQVKGSVASVASAPLFDPKTVMRMEVKLLAFLEGKLNLVTPVAFVDFMMRRLGLVKHRLHSDFLLRCDRVFLCVINDSIYVSYLPSVIGTAAMCLVIKLIDPENALDYQNQLKNLLHISEKDLESCSRFMSDVLEKHGSGLKRKHPAAPRSPSAVMDAYFSSDNSSNSWALPLSKRNRAQDQQT